MRIFGTVVFGLLFTLSLSAYLVFDSVTTLPLDSTAFTSVLRKGDVRTALLDAVETSVRREVRTGEDPEFAESVVGHVREELDAVLTDDWFYGTAEQMHRGLVSFLRDGTVDQGVELKNTKQQIREQLLSLGDRLTSTCDQFGGGRECRAAARDVRITLGRYRGQINRALRQVPDRIDARWVIATAGGRPGDLTASDDARRVREGFALFSRLRWAGLAGLLVLLGLITLVNKRTLPRMLFNVGLVLTVAGGIYLSGVSTLQGHARREFAREDRRLDESEVTEETIAQRAGQRFGAALVDSMFARSCRLAGVAAGLGLALLAGGVGLHFVRRGRGGPATGTPPHPPFVPWTGPGPFPPIGPIPPQGASRVRCVISDRVPTRTGGPQNPVPSLT